MNNFHISVTSEGDGPLLTALQIAFNNAPGRRATHYEVDAKKGLIFYWHEDRRGTAFPFKMDSEGAADFASRWLAEADYGKQPDHDGDNGKGWRVYTEGWGKIEGTTYGFVAVQPVWAMYGK